MNKPTIPHNADAERGLIGAAIVDGSLTELIDITSEDFYIERHGWIWAAIQSMARRGVRPDLVTLIDQLQNDGKLKDIGGMAYITELVAHSVTSLGAEDYAAIVREQAERRGLLSVAQQIARDVYDQGKKPDAGNYIDKLVASTRPEHGAVHWREYIKKLWAQVEQHMADPGDFWGIPTGFNSFDKVTGGLQLGETLLMSGKPGVGKTMWATQACVQMAQHSPGAIYSVEMKGESVIRRVLSAETHISARDLKRGVIQSTAPLLKAITKLEKLPVYMSDAAGWTTTGLRADLARLKVRHGIQWFMFDYLLLANDMQGLDEIERTAAISRGMKLTARHLDMAGLIIHSMNKSGMDANVPGMSSLRGSGQVAFDADVIVFLTDFQEMSTADAAIPPSDRENMRTLFFGKGRELEDPRKYIHFVKQPNFPQFGEYIPEKRGQYDMR